MRFGLALSNNEIGLSFLQDVFIWFTIVCIDSIWLHTQTPVHKNCWYKGVVPRIEVDELYPIAMLIALFAANSANTRY